MVEPAYFFTQTRWDEHMRALQRERRGDGSATWSATEYLPQGTVGAVAVDSEAVVCVATSTGGLTNKLTGRVGDTPVVGSGFWAEEWADSMAATDWAESMRRLGTTSAPAVMLSAALKRLLAECLPVPAAYLPLPQSTTGLQTTRSMAVSGTGNGDSFMRTCAARTVGAVARFSGVSTAEAVSRIAGQDGELQKSAGDRWGRTGEGEGGIIGIECVVIRDRDGAIVEAKSHIIQDFNCGGMFRAWVDDAGQTHVRIWRQDEELDR